jgi:hypothetical protein
LGLKTHRPRAKETLIEYRQKLDIWCRLNILDQLEFLRCQDTQTGILNAIFEEETLIQIWKGFRSKASPPLVSKLKELLDGPPFVDAENKTHARNTSFELQLAAYLDGAGLDVDFGHPTDWEFDFCGIRFLVECKRLQKPNAILGNIEDAESQLGRKLSMADAKSKRGLIAIDAAKIYHLGYTGRPLYPRATIGNALLPASFLAADTEEQLIRLMNFRFLACAVPYRAFGSGSLNRASSA